MPLSDRDYMRSAQPSRRPRRWGDFNIGMSPVMALIIANIILFLATELTHVGVYPYGPYAQVQSDRFTYYLGLIPYYFASRPWTLITSMFIHSGFMHIFGNMIALFFFGTFFNRMVGNRRFLLVYFVGGIVGNVLFLLLNLHSLDLVIGASGAVYAIAGAMVVMVPRLPVRLYFLIPIPLWVFVIVFLGLLSFPPFTAANIAWQAHMGGLATGLVFGWFFRKKIRVGFYQ